MDVSGLVWIARGLLCVALAGHSAPAAAQRGQLNAVESLDYGTFLAGRVAIRVGLRYPLKGPPSVFRIFHPDLRIVFEFPDTTVGTAQRTFPIDRGALRSVHLVRQGTRTRLVIGLARPVTYETQIEGNDLIIILERGRAGAAADRIERFGPAGAPLHRIREIAFRRGGSGEGRVIVSVSEPAPAASIREQGRQLIVDFPDTGIAPSALQRLDVLDFATPIASITTTAAGNSVRLVIEPLGSYQYTAYQAGPELVVDLTHSPELRPESLRR